MLFARVLLVITVVAGASSCKRSGKAKADAQVVHTAKELFTPSPELMGPVAKLKFGMSRAEVKAAAPELPTDGMPLALPAYGVSFTAYFDGDKLSKVAVKSERDPLDKLTREAWGPGRASRDPGDQWVAWWNPARKLRASVDEYGLAFEPYVPVRDLLGAGPEFAFLNGRPLLGANLEELRRDFAGLLVEDPITSKLVLPRTEWEDSNTEVTFMLDLAEPRARVRAFSIALDYRSVGEAGQELSELFVSKWGPSKKVPYPGDPNKLFDSWDGISAHNSPAGWSLEVVPGTPPPAPTPDGGVIDEPAPTP